MFKQGYFITDILSMSLSLLCNLLQNVFDIHKRYFCLHNECQFTRP